MDNLRKNSSMQRAAWAAAGASLFAVLLLAACGKPSPVTPPQVHKTQASSHPVVRAASSDNAAYDKLATSVEKEISVEDERLEKQVDDLLREHPGLNAQQLLGVPEVTESLRDFLQHLAKDPELQKKMNSSVAFTAEMRDLRETNENLHFSMDLSGYSSDRTRRLLTSLLSHNPDRVVDFFEKETSEAAAEFAVDPSTPKSLNGITVEARPKAPNP
jgi:hypothetical protein